MGASALRARLTLETPISSADGGGGTATSWAPIGTHYAAIEATRGVETLAGSAQAQRVTHRVTVRHAPMGGAARPRADQRFRSGARTLSIRAVFEADAGGRRLVCLCGETNQP